MIGLINPHFQSIVSVNGGKPYALEALLRFQNHETISHGQIKLWEKSGYITHIDITMLKHLRQRLLQQISPIGFRLAVNVSVKTIEIAAEDYINALQELAPLVRRLIVEITETYEPNDWQKVCDFTRQLKQSGIYVALDDCSPSNVFSDSDFVQAVSPDFLKIDGRLLNDCEESKNLESMVSMVKLGRQVGAQIIAEHVDSMSKYDLAAKLGIKLLQGWLIDKPRDMKLGFS